MNPPPVRCFVVGLWVFALAPGASRAQSGEPPPSEVRVVHETRPGSPQPAPLSFLGWRGEHPVIATPAGPLAVDPDTGEGHWVDAWAGPRGPRAAEDVFLFENGVWRLGPDGAPDPRLQAKTTRWTLGRLMPVAGQLFVQAWHPVEDVVLLEVVGDQLRWVRDIEAAGDAVRSDGRSLWLGLTSTNPEEATRLVRRDVDGTETVVWTEGGASWRLLDVVRVGDRTVVKGTDGVYVVDDEAGLLRLVPDDVRGTPPRLLGGALEVTPSRVWTELGNWVVSTDGTPNGTAWYEASGLTFLAAATRDHAAVRRGPGLSDVDVLDANGEVIDGAANVYGVVSFGEVLIVASLDGTGLALRRFVDGRGWEPMGTLGFSGLGLAPWLASPEGGGFMLDQPPGSVPELVRYDRQGAEVARVAVPFGALEGEVAALVLPSVSEPLPEQPFFGPQALAALASGEVVVGGGGFSAGFSIVDLGDETPILERNDDTFVSSDGAAVHWVEGAPPASPDEPRLRYLSRWQPNVGVERVVELTSNRSVREGVGGRPFVETWASSNSRDPWLQVDASGTAVEVFPTLSTGAPVGQVREDGVWIVEELADTFGVSRWDFERQARVSVGAVLRDSEIPVGPLSLWVLGDRPTAWVGTQEDNDGTLRLRSLDGEERVLETPVSGSFGLFPRARPRLLERGARVYAAEAGVLRALDGLNGVTEAVDTSWGVVFAAQDAPAGEWDDDVDPRQAVGGAPPGGTWSGRELWLLPKDGEPVQRLADLYPGPDGSEPAGFAVLPAEDGGEDLVLFHALTPDRGRELWRAEATGEVRPVCELAPGAAPGVPVWADIRVGPDVAFVAAFVPGTGTEVVAIPKAAVAADAVDAAACRVVPPVGRLGEAGSGCGCRTAGEAGASVAWLLLMVGLLVIARRSRRD